MNKFGVTNNLAMASTLIDAYGWDSAIKNCFPKPGDIGGWPPGALPKDNDKKEYQDIITRLLGGSDYPPSNTIKTLAGFTIQIALAGYDKSDIVVEQVDNKLNVIGKKQEPTTETEYIHKGLSFKAFTKVFTLPAYAIISSVTMKDGLLTIVVEEEKPKINKIIFKIN